ncbi:5' exonuclease Apollo-like isoform X1 [Brienomyrus brachyistius]|uniref:5' exonuclease Apollo isoform X1 n=2 Tax=Brienomyrus brachyistius TaxID=42636 RepID=UPI0020B29815|nr:5' exonuclease Apollo isoform X1 [Brienomyrus brachyistius]XP_048861667.1 5' exonuclease Apollo-like isoform X1 [Brienomyrus brachyistius]
MNGRVIPNTPLAVDFWQVRKCGHVRLFFLSHMHSDHTVGLTSTWANRPIYCSPISAKLLKLKLQVREKWIHALEVGEAHKLPLDDMGKETLTVTLMDANHCPGAVMFLFQGYFGTILFTGDFRYTAAMLRDPSLRNHISIDVLYLDDTHCDPTRSLPSRQQATQQIKEIIRAHTGHDVVIGLYTLGKETLLVQLALEFRTWVEVSPERMRILHVLELPDVFTTEPGAGRIRVVDHSEVCAANLLLWNRQRPTIAILPTGRPVIATHPSVHVVPYSDHSSFQELEDFVSALQPASLVPIVGPCVPRLSALVSPRKRCRPTIIPESVRRGMIQGLEQESACCSRLAITARPAASGVVFDSPQRAQASPFRCKPSPSDEQDSDVGEDGQGAHSFLHHAVSELGPGDTWAPNGTAGLVDDLEIADSFFLSQLTPSDWMLYPPGPLLSLGPSLKPKSGQPSPKGNGYLQPPTMSPERGRKIAGSQGAHGSVDEDPIPSTKLHDPEMILLEEPLTFLDEEIHGRFECTGCDSINNFRLVPWSTCPKEWSTFHGAVEHFLMACKN